MAADLPRVSGVPSRVLCLEPGADRWTDVAVRVLPHLQHAVARGCPVTRMPFAGGHCHVYDFPHMRRYVEAQPISSVPLAWYDEAGCRHFPAGLDHVPVATSAESCTVSADDAVSIVRSWTLDLAAVTGAEISVPGELTQSIFGDMENQMGINGVKLGWYGASPGDVRMASASLFRSPNWHLLGAERAHGRGLHFSPLRFPHLSMAIAEADHSGEAWVLLCRILQGMPMAINAGSDLSQNMPAGVQSAGSVDNILNPSWYVVWAEDMNMCVLPMCMVSFMKRPLGPRGSLVPWGQVAVDLKKLRKEIKRVLPYSQLQDLDNFFDTNTGNAYTFSKLVSGLIGVDMFVGAILKALEHCFSDNCAQILLGKPLL